MTWRDLRRRITRMAGTRRSVTVHNGTVTNTVGGLPGSGLQGRGEVVTRVREGLLPFDRIATVALADVTVLVADADPEPDLRLDDAGRHPFRAPAPGSLAHRVSVTAQPEIHAGIATHVHDGTLYIGTTQSYTTDRSVEIEIRLPTLVSLQADGQGDIEIARFRGDVLVIRHNGIGDMLLEGGPDKELGLSLAGQGDVRCDGLATERVRVEHGGLGDLTMAGTCTQLTANLRGQGDARLAGLRAQTLVVNGSGQGDIDICCTGTATGLLAGMGDVRVEGRPDWRVDVRGLVSVRFG